MINENIDVSRKLANDVMGRKRLLFSITTSKKIRTNPPKDSSKRDIIEVVKSDNIYLASLKNAIVYSKFNLMQFG
ncbi:hypothetical protein CAEBREN_01027 [Caenorhabditis brenneri]|uniref:Uncharacterized protein n=1 Tax=Caenorhabditis brenneri TaxID=135651 RepID=G0MCK8_CAEBE|nr:hypothetical protein CAEBREN_01027 [Caenorhabditis brenneri]